MRTSEITRPLMVEGCSGCKCLQKHLEFMERRIEEIREAQAESEQYPSGMKAELKPKPPKEPGKTDCGIGDYA